MKIELSGAGKRFNREWIFRNANLVFEPGGSYAITGPNGSGKSTLLQCIGGILQLNEGTINYSRSGQLNWNAEETFRHISFCAPYLDVIEEMTLLEFLHFHNQFKPFTKGINIHDLMDKFGLGSSSTKQIRYFSSGMKQRVKLAQAIFSDVAVVLLDEPCSNLDASGIDLYRSLIEEFCKERLVLVSSNDPVEYEFCHEVISITKFKSHKVFK